MPNVHGRDEYTLERMLERRNRNNIRKKVLEHNGRRLTAKEIDIVNLCSRHSERRYTLFTYYCDANCMQLIPDVLPHLSMLDHYHHHHCQQQQKMESSFESDRCASTSFVASLLIQLNVEANAANSCRDGQSEFGRPCTSRVTFPCYLLTNRPKASASSSLEFNSTVNLIADIIIESFKSSSDKGNDENGSSDKANSRKGSRKNSKKKKRKKNRTKAGPSKAQTRFDSNSSNEPCVSSDSSSSSHVEISLVDGDGGDQRVKSDSETTLRCVSSNLSDWSHADVGCSNAILSDEEGEDKKLALPKTYGSARDAINEDMSAFEEMNKADKAQWSSNTCIINDFIPVGFGRKGRCGKRFCQQGSHPSRCVAFDGHSGDQFSTWQHKPSKKSSLMKYFKPRYSRIETSTAPESIEKIDTSSKPDSEADANRVPTKLPNDNVSRHSGEYVFKKDDFPSLPSPNNDLKEVIRCKVGQRSPRRDDLQKPHVSLSSFPEQCKQSESVVVDDIKLNIPVLKVKIDEMEESSSGSGSSSGAFFSPNSSKSSQMNQSSHDTSSTDSPRSSKASDETQVRPDMCPFDTNEGHDVSHLGRNIFASDDKSTIGLTQSGCDTCPSDLYKNTPADVDAGSSTCSSLASATLISPSSNMSCVDIGEFKKMRAICSTDLLEILRAVQAAHKVYQIAESVQATFVGPFADYELLCHYAAPVVSLPPHQIINVPLQKIWQWYEEPSCYGLEVKGCQDHQRWVKFTAHFVPSLSAIQLFVHGGSSATFSKQMPKQGESESALDVEDVSGVNVESAELVFEFFEYEQPYLRQTLFEKVKELVEGVAQGRSHVNGNAHNLKQLHIGDLHPSSWYSVAWYPTYRIPEGRSSFKAAFLTYHSLAHFVPKVASPLVDDRVVVSSFPVVGLMSYNTQEESWYHERYQTDGEMEERLESLNLTAAVMARAQVTRGDQVSRNHHPDFEFFASRQYPN